MRCSLVTVGEEAGGLDDHVDSKVAPRNLCRVTVRDDLQQVAVNVNAVIGHADLAWERSRN
ncbi:unannotated protein [freshwater metagenome]|uniref:Unannotated protein n=1 Tax=freshwater metagenome TaxID=449393 RepID=A0A6J7UPM8_9ZZZZ